MVDLQARVKQILPVKVWLVTSQEGDIVTGQGYKLK